MAHAMNCIGCGKPVRRKSDGSTIHISTMTNPMTNEVVVFGDLGMGCKGAVKANA